MKHPPPSAALKFYRRMSPEFVRDQANQFVRMPTQDQLELLFFMVVHQANTLGIIGEEVDVELVEMDIPKDN